MPIPLVVAAPAAVAAAAYLNARSQLSSDLPMLATLVQNAIVAARLDKQDRVNLFYRLEEHAQNPKLKDHAYLIYEGRSWTFEESYNIVLKYAAFLKTEHGVGAKEIIALDYMNSPKFLFIFMACWSLGAIPALINYNLTSTPLLHCVKTATARLILVDDEVQSKFTDEVMTALAKDDFREGGKGPVQVKFHDAALEARVEAIQNPERPPDSVRAGAGFNQGDRTSALIYTSGTTGLPKAAIVSWVKHYGAANMMTTTIGLRKDDIYYTCMPLYHSTALVLAAMTCLIKGITVAIGHKFSNKLFWPDVRASKATVIQYVGETCRYLVAAPPQHDPVTGEDLDKQNHVRMAFGNGMRPDVWQRFKDRFDIETIAEFYGATEAPGASMNVSSNDFSRGAIGKRGSLIQLLTRSTAVVVELDWETEEPKRDPARNNLCTRAGADVPGELLFAIDPKDITTKYQGYFGNEKSSNAKILRNVLAQGDAWFRTGDAVRADKEGLMWFCDRIGDTFRWRSENVSTNEVSEVLGHHPAIVEANVYGVEVPQHDGRCGCAAITVNTELEPRVLQSLAAQALGNLPKYAVPLFLRVMQEMQSTGNNKQQKHGLRLQGVDPRKVNDRLLWLKGDTYVDFGLDDYKQISAGQVKL